MKKRLKSIFRFYFGCSANFFFRVYPGEHIYFMQSDLLSLHSAHKKSQIFICYIDLFYQNICIYSPNNECLCLLMLFLFK